VPPLTDATCGRVEKLLVAALELSLLPRFDGLSVQALSPPVRKRSADIAALAVHLMTNTAITGAALVIDGGQRLSRGETVSDPGEASDQRPDGLGHQSPRIVGRFMVDEPFSVQLERWLEGDEPKTLGRLGEVFKEKAFAVAVLLLMITPALPLPTGGITHVFAAVTVLLGAEMVVGAKTIWLPSRWRRRELGRTARKALPVMMRRIRSLERMSRRRGAHLFERAWFLRVLGVLLIAFAIGAAIAPPFSGLDTFPAIGAVGVALAIVLEDVLILAIGVAIGAGGVVLTFTLGAAVFRFLQGLF
jgi:hypothetical protein